jgi:hypothetical protein
MKKTQTPPSAAPSGTIHRSISLLLSALDDLGVRIGLMDVERLAVMINRAMTAWTRSFHTPEHIFHLVDPGNPHITLAALFHDLVYYSVDLGFDPEIEEAIRSNIELRDDGLWLRPARTGDDPSLDMCLGVFGMEAGRNLSSSGGMNEFLSALVMNRRLAGAVPAADLLIATGCIEATIPFRKPGASGETPAEALFLRLSGTADRLAVPLDGGRLEQAVKWAVTFANRDVANFGEEDVTRFLDNTWKLLPESNPSLRIQGVYTIRSYRTALQKMEGFLRFLDPDTIFARFRGMPADRDFQGMRRRAERNVTTARDYLGIKLLTAAILEALAEVTGGDAPMSLFMGDLGAGGKGDRIDDHLPAYSPAPGLSLDPVLHDLLAHGRASASSFDLQNSPLSQFLYLHLGTEETRLRLDGARSMFAGSVAARVFLDSLPPDMAAAVARACARMVITRSGALEEYAASRAADAAGPV